MKYLIYRFGQDGAEVLKDAIMLSISIQYLNLSFCNLGDVGGSFVAKAMEQNESCLVRKLNT